MAEKELIHDICEAFEMSEASWSKVDQQNPADSMLFYLAALRMFEEKPFRDEAVHAQIHEFLLAKLALASERRFADLAMHLKKVYKKHEEII